MLINLNVERNFILLYICKIRLNKILFYLIYVKYIIRKNIILCILLNAKYVTFTV